jgi:hypothetical protein
MRLATMPGMTHTNSSRVIVLGQFLRPVAHATTSLNVNAVDEPLSNRAARRRHDTAPSRVGRLRLAPRLTLLHGNRREPNWRTIAGGIGTVMAGDGGDLDETPWIA